jgi:hypothetical protein
MRDFSAAVSTLKTAQLNMAKNWVFDARHADEARYHAFRFIIPDTVMIGVAKSITLDDAGHIRIVQEPGAPLVGRPNKTHHEYSHVLVPASVSPPT